MPQMGEAAERGFYKALRYGLRIFVTLTYHCIELISATKLK